MAIDCRRLKSMALVLSVCILLALAASTCAANAITLVFRYDDYSTTSPLEMDKKVIEAFRAHGVAVTFAVIPAVRDTLHKGVVLPLTAERAAVLKDALQAGRFEVAQHGYSHRSIPGRTQTEFAGQPGPQQEQLLRDGREILQSRLGISIGAFVPPWNSFDEQTLAALERLGFTTISAARPYAPAGQSTLRFAPETCTSLAGLKQSIAGARELGDGYTLIIPVLHAYDFKEHDAKRGRTTIGELSALLDWVKAQGDVQTRTLSEAAAADPTLTATRCRRWQAHDAAERLLPTFLQQTTLYVSEAGFDRLQTRRTRLLAIVYAALLLGPLLLALVAMRFSPAWARRLPVLGILTALGLGVATFIILRHGRPVEWNWQRLAAPTALAGAILGIWGQRLLLRSRAQ